MSADTRDVDAAVVAFYGTTTDTGLDEHVAGVQQVVLEHLGDLFRPRPTGLVHSTLVGLDSRGPFAGAEALTATADHVLRDAAETVWRWAGSPTTLQFGGFADTDLAVRSRGARLYERAVAVHGDQVVMVGWPVSPAGEPTVALTDVRRELARLGVEHRYELDGPFGDPDAHMVIGELTGPLDPVAREHFLVRMREVMATMPHRTPVRREALSVVVYSDPSLPAGTTDQLTLPDLGAWPQNRSR